MKKNYLYQENFTIKEKINSNQVFTDLNNLIKEKIKFSINEEEELQKKKSYLH